MRPTPAFVACTHRHFSETGFVLAFPFIAFDLIAPILSHFCAFVNEYTLHTRKFIRL